jgi:hypothetical protein
MSPESPENYQPSQESLDAAARLAAGVASGDHPEIDEATAIVHRESLAEQRRGLQEKLFQASDALEATPHDFEQREVLRHILSAASRLSDAEGFMPTTRTSWAINQLTEALALLRASAPENVETE